MSKHTLLLPLLLVSGLACILAGTPLQSSVRVRSVAVSPASSTAQDSFMVTVIYEIGEVGGLIECDLDGTLVHSISVTTTKMNSYREEGWDFFFLQSDKPGERIVACKSPETTVRAATFTVAGEATTIPTVTPTSIPTATAANTTIPVVTMNGTFNLNWSNPTGATLNSSGIIELTIDWTTGKATASLSGSGNGTSPNTCVPSVPWNQIVEYEAMLDGSLDAQTGAISLNGTSRSGTEAVSPLTCYCNDGYCDPGSKTSPFLPILKLEGIVDRGGGTGKGRVFVTTCAEGAMCEGDWHAGE